MPTIFIINCRRIKEFVRLYYLNCWKSVKQRKPQRKDEIGLDLKVAKAEKISLIA